MKRNKEIYKEIKGYKGFFISNFGNVKSSSKKLSAVNGRMKQQKSRLGYLMITFLHGENKKSFPVHRLVALHFLKADKSRNEVNHLDFNRENNNVNNLEWCTRKENVEYSKRAGKYKWDRSHLKNPRSLEQIAIKHGIKPITLVARIRRGWTLKKAINTPIGPNWGNR